ncbi:MAG TPA: hypothetical protein VLT36_00685 [Candidatus Dormibacteraeota bacterium]|nr:hypothetical protein [Candidatus Dormibacteraeota bacterium]
MNKVLLSLTLALCAATSLAAPASKVPATPKPEPPLFLYPACPCYHLKGIGSGDTRLDAKVNPPESATALRVTFDVSDSNGKVIQNASANVSKPGFVGVNIRVPVQALAAFNVRARLLDSAGKELASATTDIHVAPREQSDVRLGSDGYLRVAGQPEFVLGMYSAGHFDQMGKAGFNATHSYAITTGEADEPINPTDNRVKQLLDNSWTNGMRLMVELPRKAIEKASWDQVRRRIETFRYHPGLLCWGSEERVARGVAPLTNIATLYKIVHELDPARPLVLGDTKDKIAKFKTDRRDFFPDPYMDAGIWWWYPIPLKEPDANGLDGREQSAGAMLNPPAWLTTTISKRPLWIAIQSYQHPSKDARFPTPAEYRCMAYISIINGVKGLWFYTGSGQKDYLGKPAGLLNKMEEGHWDYVKNLVGELKEFSPVIMAQPSAGKVSLSPPDAPIEFTTRELGAKLFLLTANKSEKAQTATFKSPALIGKHATLLYESRKANVTGDSLGDSFEPFAVHLYRFE